LQRMWRDELSYQQVSAVFDLREAGGVSRWDRQYHEGGFDALHVGAQLNLTHRFHLNLTHPETA
ncbi:helix-turn-helix domain-containing protein, partial [Ralstonia solanacearum species complex bacterium KE101]|uniref:helix-turn-helix domain-containing protein n=1 Tax=Ralstonia solanacearum species complex bacterium KE101 TaxID=3119587 RepID=UPI003B281EC9